MNQKEAVEKLKAAGLRTHDLDQFGIMGGGFVDRSANIGMIQDCYCLKPNPDGSYETQIENLHLIQDMPLDEAVALIIKSIIPKPDIEAPSRPSTPGQPQEY